MSRKRDSSERNKHVLQEHLCACGAWGAFGLGWPASPIQRWFCRACLPADFLPHQRSVAA